MKKIRVFPDYMASGLWATHEDGGANLGVEEFKDVLTPEIIVALKYWVFLWELAAEDSTVNPIKLSPQGWADWWTDGAVLVERMNAVQPVQTVEFIYDVACGFAGCQ